MYLAIFPAKKDSLLAFDKIGANLSTYFLKYSEGKPSNPGDFSCLHFQLTPKKDKYPRISKC